MNVVDSSGWIEFIVDGPNASEFTGPLEDHESLLVPTICILEVFRFFSRKAGEAASLEVVAAMRGGAVVDLDPELSLLAGRLGIDHGLPLADSVIYATAQRAGATVWTQDSDFEHLEDVRYVSARK